MAKVYTGRYFFNRYIEDPFDVTDRGWIHLSSYEPTNPDACFSLPAWLMFMCVSGRDEPWRDRRGRVLRGSVSSTNSYARDDWITIHVWNDGVTLYPETGGTHIKGYEPVKPMGDDFWANVLHAPFPVTLDRGLIAYAACNIGETEWVPFAPLINGRCSAEMLRLMNCFPHKPAFIVYEGHLFVWINLDKWMKAEPEVSYRIPQPYIELEMFRAYRAYYEQLVRELPMPYRGPVRWPDQCDPRFPLSSDPRGAHYGMWLYSGGLTYGEHAYDRGLSQNSVRNRRLNL